MKMIEAIVQPYKLEDIKQALTLIDVHGVTVSEVRGFGRQKGQRSHYRGSVSNADLIPKLKLQLVVSDGQSDQAQEALARAARTGKVGDGKIFVYPLDNVVRIRTGERDDSAI